MSGSYRHGLVTPLLRLSGPTSSVSPPRNANARVELAPPPVVQLVELGELISIGTGLPVLLPQKDLGDAFLAELPVNVFPVRHRTGSGRGGGHWGEETLQSAV